MPRFKLNFTFVLYYFLSWFKKDSTFVYVIVIAYSFHIQTLGYSSRAKNRRNRAPSLSRCGKSFPRRRIQKIQRFPRTQCGRSVSINLARREWKKFETITREKEEGGDIPAWSRNMNLDKWRAAFHWNGRKGNRILQEKRKIRGGEKDRWRLRRRLWKSWFQSRSLSIRFRFVSIAKF